MPEEHLLLEPVKLDIRGFESRRALQNVLPVDWFCPSGRKKERYTKSCARTFFILTFVIIRQSEKRFGASRRAMQKQAEKLDKKHYLVKIKYAHDDEPEMVIRILSFGPMIEVLESESFRKLVIEKLKKQLNCGLK